MPLSSGTFTRVYNWVTDRNNTVKIRADRMDEEFDGIATALSTAIYRDGQSTISANIPFNNKKITGLGDATADADALNRQTADARYTLNIPDLTNESAVADADSFPFYDASAAANRRVTYTQLKSDIIAETNFIPANKVINTAAGNISATTVQAAIDELDSEKVGTGRTLTAAGLVTGGGTLAADRTFTVTAATQSDMETGTSTTAAVVPGVMKHHKGVAKALVSVTYSGGTPSLVAADSLNITSITDEGLGDLTVTIADDLSTSTYVICGTAIVSTGNYFVSPVSRAAGSFRVNVRNAGGSAVDPDALTLSVHGDFA